MRQFEYSDAKSHKFWNIEVTGTSYTVNYGKIGTTGQTKTKEFGTEEKCQAEADKLIREKTGKGYVEIGLATVTSDREAIEASLRADPDDRTGFAAYADLLQEQGDDARAEFIRVQLELEDESLPKPKRTKLQKREKELLKAHQREWLGEFAPFILDQEISDYARKNPEYTSFPLWKHGCLMGFHLYQMSSEMARALNRSADQFPLLRELQIYESRYEEEGEFESGPDIPADMEVLYPGMAILARFPLWKQIRVLLLGNLDDLNQEYHSCHTEGSFAHQYVKQMPDVEELHLLCHETNTTNLFGLPMPKLRVLNVYHIHQFPLAKLAKNASLTNLERLGCFPRPDDGEFDEDETTPSLADLRALGKSKTLTSLKHLQLRKCQFGNQGVKAIIDSGLLGRLKTLDLRFGAVTDEGAEMFAKADLSNLDWLDLTENAMTEAGIAKLKATGVNLLADKQHDAEDDEWLYYGDCE